MSKAKREEKKEGADVATRDPVKQMRERGKSPELAALLAWIIPGSGHIYAGSPIKGGGALVLVLGLFMSGLILSKGEAVSLHEEGGHEYAFLAQIGAGLPTGLALAYTHGKLPGTEQPPHPREQVDEPAYAARLPDLDTGLLFTMIAGLLNLLLIHDALNGVPGAMARRAEERRRKRRLDQLREELAEEAAPDEASGVASKSEEPDKSEQPEETAEAVAESGEQAEEPRGGEA